MMGQAAATVSPEEHASNAPSVQDGAGTASHRIIPPTGMPFDIDSATRDPEGVPHFEIVSNAVPNSAEGSSPSVVHGVPMIDQQLSSSLRRVILLSALVASYYVCLFIWRLLRGMYGHGQQGPSDALWSGLSQLAIELSIPACGYYGALYAHRTLIFFFCGANIIFIVAAAIGLFRLIVIFGSTSGQLCETEYSNTRSTCDIVTGEGPEKYFLIVSLAVLTFFGGMSFFAGKRLYQGLGPSETHENVHNNSLPLMGEIVSLRPGAGPVSDENVPIRTPSTSENTS